MMNLEEQLAAAVGAHGLWKGRLRAAVQRGIADVPVSVVRDDSQCAFGKWLKGPTVDGAVKRSKHYANCVELHRRFHLAAAEVLSLALAGKKQEAFTALGAGHEFAKISLDLSRAMLAWQDAEHSQLACK